MSPPNQGSWPGLLGYAGMWALNTLLLVDIDYFIQIKEGMRTSLRLNLPHMLVKYVPTLFQHIMIYLHYGMSITIH